jgi:hypothetical protein
MNLNIELLPQEQSTKAKFDSKVYVTAGFQEKYKNHPGICIRILNEIWKRADSEEGADYFQVAKVNGERLYVIDDTDHITFLLPSEY